MLIDYQFVTYLLYLLIVTQHSLQFMSSKITDWSCNRLPAILLFANKLVSQHGLQFMSSKINCLELQPRLSAVLILLFANKLVLQINTACKMERFLPPGKISNLWVDPVWIEMGGRPVKTIYIVHFILFSKF